MRALLTRRRLVSYALRLAIGLSIGQGVAHAQTPDEVRATIQDAAARHGVDGQRLIEVANCESSFNPRAVGALGEQGLFQLLGNGARAIFYAEGYTDVWSAAQQSDFAAMMWATGRSIHWPTRNMTCRR